MSASARARKGRTLRLVSPPAKLKTALDEVVRLFPERFGGDTRALAVRFKPLAAENGAGRCELSVEADGVAIGYTDTVRALRALGRLMGRLAAGHAPEAFVETVDADFSGVMLDCSRNAVATVERLREWTVRLALMGIGSLMLYIEDTYEIDGEPFFGYGRGRYSAKELKAVDDFAHACGMEVVACIQTLGHLEQMLRWPVYAHLVDQHSVIMPDDPESYRVIEKMIDAIGKALRSKRIHIGMDEAHGVGLGRYYQKNGIVPRFEIMTRHLDRVRGFCAKRGLTPWIWSDMFFRLGSKHNDYYDRKAKMPADLPEKIPADLRLVYWDYYHTDPKFYAEFIRRHRKLGSEPILALGGWTWSVLWPQLRYALESVKAGMEGARAEKLRESYITLWGDDGAECDQKNAWPAVQYYAEFLYAKKVDPERLKENFLGSTGGHWDDWLAACELDRLPGPMAKPEVGVSNPSRWLLWQDPMLAFRDPFIKPEREAKYYAKQAALLSRLAGRDAHAAPLKLSARLAAALAAKIPLRSRASALLRAKDKAGIKAFLRRDLPAAEKAVRELWECHRAAWMAANKPNGWEVIDHRYGGLLARFATMAARLEAWCRDGEPVPELLEKFISLPESLEHEVRWQGRYGGVATPSTLR